MGADISWYKDEEKIEDNTVQLSPEKLTIKNVDGDHFGVYECKASNTRGTKTKKITVTSCK